MTQCEDEWVSMISFSLVGQKSVGYLKRACFSFMAHDATAA